MTRPVDSPWSLVLPAAFLHVWPEGKGAGWEALVERLCAAVGPGAGVHRLRPDLVAVVPVAGDPGVLDTAVSYGRLLAAEAAEALPPAAAAAGLLVAPGTVAVRDGTAAAVPDPLLDDLTRRRPRLAPGEVHLTGRAALTLEAPREVRGAGKFEGPSGRAVPLAVCGEVKPPARSWRNPELLGRRPKAVERAAVADALRDPAAGPVVRVTGPLGSGKTRAVLEEVATTPGTVVRAAAPAPRSAEATLEMQIATRWLALSGAVERVVAEGRTRALVAARRRLLGGAPPGGPVSLTRLLLRAAERLSAEGQGPLTLIGDDLERAGTDDFTALGQLVEAARPGLLRLILIGRHGTAWPAGWSALPLVEVPPFSDAEMAALADHLLTGLSAPPPVRERFLAAAAGNPFFFEEGIANLIHRKQVRRIYGNYFFSGDEETPFTPSARLVQHVEAEAGRLGSPLPLRLSALAGGALPASELRSAASILDPTAGGGGPAWPAPYAAAGWLAEVESPWGPAVALTCEVVAQALSGTVASGAAARARHTLGELLVDLSRDAEARWRCYRLLAGTAEAVPVLLALARDEVAGQAGGDDAELRDALSAELTAHRERAGDEATELELLLARAPVALRLARLDGLEEDLSRAAQLAAGRAATDPEILLEVTRLQADLDRRRGRLEGAEEALRSALKTAGAIGEAGKAALLLELGRLLIQQERHDEAEKLLHQILDSAGDGEGGEQLELIAKCRFYLGNIALHRNRIGAAFEHHRAALDHRRELGGEAKPLVVSLTAMGAVCLAKGLYSEALAHYREAEAAARALGDEFELAYVLLGVGRAMARLGDFAGASGPLRQALALRAGAGDVLGEALARLAVAENFLDLDLPREALREAREVHFRMSLLGDNAPLGRAEALLGRILLSRRRNAAARSHLLRAYERQRDRGDRVGAATCRGWLLDEAVASERADDVFLLTRALTDFLEGTEYPELGERLDYRLYRALAWLHGRGERVAHPLVHLRRAYAALMRKAGLLAPEQRQRFLHQVAENRAILAAGARHHLG